MLKQRILTAAILVPLTLLVLFYFDPVPFCLVTAMIVLGGAWEWTNFMGLQKISQKITYLLCMFLIFSWVFFVPIMWLFSLALVWWLCATVLVMLYPRASAWWSKGYIWRGLMGVLVLTPSWAALNYIHNQNDGVYILLFVLLLIWGADSAAYFVGKKWGKDKLAPAVSPGKSRQGLYGALIAGILITIVALLIGQVPFAIWPWAIGLSLITILFSVVGDLFESMMKRQVGLKDSGAILPGHGGIMDRIDSLTAAAPMFVIGGLLLGLYLK